MSDSGAIYRFDEVDEELSLLPMAARRALELVGARLSLEGWRSLTQADRMALVSAGAFAEVDPELIRSIVARASPAAVPIEPRSDPDPAKPPTELVDALGEKKPMSGMRWASLRPLDRYALSRAASSSGSRLERAYDEIVERSLSHLSASGEVHMVDIADKNPTRRRATATAPVKMHAQTLARVAAGETAKGDVFATARVAGIQAAKRTSELIPLCHHIALTRVTIELTPDAPAHSEVAAIHVKATVEAFDRTGVEMEALVAATTSALTIYDMLKAIDRWMTITDVGLLEKSGGRSGTLRRGER